MTRLRRRALADLQHLEARQLLSVVVAERENNNKSSKANAFAFDADGVVQLQGTALNRNDRDFFRFTAPSTGPLGFAVQTRNGVFAQLEVETASGISLVESQPKNGINAGTVNLTAGQSYLIRLRSPVNVAAAYSVELSMGGTASGTMTPNPTPVSVVRESKLDDRPTRANAVTLIPNHVVRLQGNVNQNDRDYFTFVSAENGVLNIDARTTNGVLAKVEVQDGIGRNLFETEPNNGKTAGSVAIVAGQPLLLRVRSSVKNQSAAYAIDLLFTRSDSATGGGSGTGTPAPTGTVSESEPNNTKGSADSFSFGIAGAAKLEGTATGTADPDYFSFIADRSGSLSAVVSSSNGTFADLEIENSQGLKVLETEAGDGQNSATGTIVAGQTYFARLRSRTDAPAGYLVDLLFDQPGNGTGSGGTGMGGGGGGGGGGTGSLGGTFAEVESNGDQASATAFTIGVGQPAKLTGTSTSKDDRDFFAFIPTTSGTLNVSVSSTSGALAEVEIETSASLNLLELQEGQTTGSIQVVAGTSYFIRVRSPKKVSVGYQVDLTLA